MEKKKTLIDKIGIGVITFIMLAQAVFVAVIPFTEAYSVAKEHVINHTEFKKETGRIERFGLIPTGGIQMTTDAAGEYGSATINMTAKGERVFKDITVYVVKYRDSPKWEVEGLE